MVNLFGFVRTSSISVRLTESANKLGNRTLGRFTIETAGISVSSSSGQIFGIGASTDPDAYVFSSAGYLRVSLLRAPSRKGSS